MSSRPAFVEPQLPTLVDQPPTGDGWIHEIKHDGYRTMLVLAGRDRKAFTRNGFDWSNIPEFGSYSFPLMRHWFGFPC
jgi:bifunctional non-homologous end joining protein LigD